MGSKLNVMLSITVDEAQKDLPAYLKLVATGETIVLVQANEPVAEIKPISQMQELRPYGLCAGQFVVPDDFDAPLPEGILEDFEGNKIFAFFVKFEKRIIECPIKNRFVVIDINLSDLSNQFPD